MKKVARQSGSVKVFIVVAVVLALVALGVLYGTKRLAMNDQTPPMELPGDMMQTEDGQQDQPSDDDVATDEAETGADSAGNGVAEDDSATSDDDGEVASGVNTDPDSTGSGSTEPASDSADEVTGGGDTAGPQVTDGELPQTGPADTFAAFSLALVASSVVAYRRSIRHL